MECMRHSLSSPPIPYRDWEILETPLVSPLAAPATLVAADVQATMSIVNMTVANTNNFKKSFSSLLSPFCYQLQCVRFVIELEGVA